MAIFGSNEELISLLNIYRDKNYVNINFVYWLHLYPNILDVIFNWNYRELFDEAIKMYMPDLLRIMIEKHNFDKIYLLKDRYDKELFENIDLILEYDSNYAEHICELVGFDGFEEFAKKHQDTILEKAVEFNTFNYPMDYTSNLLFLMSTLPFFDTKFAKDHQEEIEKFMTSHFSAIDPQVYDKDLLFLFETIRLSCVNHSFVNEYFSKNLKFIALVFANKKLVTLEREKILDFYVELIKDSMRIEKATVKDMKLKKGANSRTLIINDKVLKSGHKITKEIPYHKRILQPVVRQRIKYFNGYVGFDIDLDFVEVYERVEDLSFEDECKAYEVFKEMLRDGVIMGDPSLDNFGVLLKPNIPYHEPTGYNDENFYIDNETIGIYDSESSREILGKDEVVVRDVDCLYYFKSVCEFIENKVVCGEKVNERSFLAVGMGDATFGPKFEAYLDKYCDEVKNEIENKSSTTFKK